MTDAQTRVALAGFGAWGQMHARAIAAIDDAEVVSVFCHSERSQAAAKEIVPHARRFSDYQAMLDAGGYDVVNVTVPNNLHSQFATTALARGVNVLLEKPVGLTLEQCDEVTAAARAAGQLVAVNHELRVSHQWRGVHDAIAAGDIGKVRYQHFALFRHKFRQGSGGWRYDRQQVGSWVLEELVHFFDLVVWFAAENGRPVSVNAFGNGTHDDLVDNFCAVLEWADGSVAVVSQCLSGFEHHTVLEIGGTDGSMRTWWSGAQDRTMHPEFELKIQRGSTDVETMVVQKSGEIFELEENLRSAFSSFRSGHSILTPEETRVAIEVCLAAEKSYRLGSPVALEAEQSSS